MALDRGLEITHLSKTFPGQRALDDVAFELRAGEVHGLLGENGSGKSTLIKVLAGYHRPDPGARVTLDGETVDLAADGPWRHRLHFIHQDPALVASLSTVENLALGRGYRTGRAKRIRWGREEARARDILTRFGITLDVWAPVGRLTATERAVIAIARALQGWDTGDWNILVLDEPTASLPATEVDVLFRVVRQVAAEGAGVVFVSHRLPEVLALTDRVTVLRNGRLVATAQTDTLDRDRLVDLIVGRAVDALYSAPPPARRDVVLDVDGLAGTTVSSVSFRLHRGEILGVAGILGSGRDELPNLLFGAAPIRRGRVSVEGRSGQVRDPRSAMALGIGLVPADRRTHATIPGQTVRQNLVLPRLGPVTKGIRLDRRAEDAEVMRWMDEVDVRPRQPERKVVNLSGGNQQKVVLAKWLRTEPAVLILDQPTQGVDVGAKAQIYALVAEAARQGVGVIVCSAEAEELAHICERVVVLREGRVAAELTGATVTEDRIVSESLSLPEPVSA